MKLTDFKYYVLLIFAMFFWGLSWPITKLMVGQGTLFQVGFFRFLLASVIYLPILILTNYKHIKTYTLIHWMKFVILAVLGIFGYGILFLWAMKLTTSSQGAVIAGIQPALIAIFSYVFFKDTLQPKWRYYGLIFSFSGVILIIGVQSFLDFNRDYLIGNIIVLCAFFFWCGYTLYGKHAMKEISSLEATTWSSFFGMLMFGIGVIVENKMDQILTFTVEFWVGIIVLGVFTTVIGFLSYFYAIQKIGTIRSGVFINLVPVFGTLSSIVILHEVISWTLWVGLVLISIGIILINFPKKIQSDELN